MKISLKTTAKAADTQHLDIHLTQRLPTHLITPCNLMCSISVKEERHYHVLKRNIQGVFDIVCQRCLGQFSHELNQTLELAVCVNDETAEMLMSRFDCFVSNVDEIDLTEILTDDLHLLLPERHENLEKCDGGVSQHIRST